MNIKKLFEVKIGVFILKLFFLKKTSSLFGFNISRRKYDIWDEKYLGFVAARAIDFAFSIFFNSFLFIIEKKYIYVI